MKQKHEMLAPFGRHLGIEILEKGEGSARIKLVHRDHLTNPGGFLHGGAIATMADSSMAIALGSLLGTPDKHYTVKLEVRYRNPVTDGEVIAEAQVTQRKQNLFLGKAVVTNGNNQVVATATGTFMVKDGGSKPS